MDSVKNILFAVANGISLPRTVALRHEKTPFRKFFICAEGETRTLKSLRSQHFECCMVTNFITPAWGQPF